MFKTLTLVLSIVCLVTYILLEIGKLILLFEYWLLKKNGLWLGVLTLSTVYTSLVIIIIPFYIYYLK